MALNPGMRCVSITTRLPSPGWSSGMPFGSARNCFQRNRLFRQSCGRCGDLKESTDHAFFHCPVVQPLCKLLEGYMVRILNGSQFCVQQCSTEVKQTGTLCMS